MRTLLAIAVAAFAVPLLAQTSAKVDVRVVNVDVSVIDAKGNTVGDLKQGDFDVLEDNQPEKITNFTTVDGVPDHANGATIPQAQLRRRVILLVDNNYIDKVDRDAALRSIDDFIDTSFDGACEWAFGMIGQQLEIVQPFTTDKKLIHAAIAKIRNAATISYGDTGMMDRAVVDDSLFQQRGTLDSIAQYESRERTTRNARSLTQTARGVVDATHAFAATEGKKLLVLLTGSIDLNTTYGAFDTGADRELQDAKTKTEKIIDIIVREANAANTSIHVIRVSSRRNATPQHDVTYHSSGTGVEGMNITAGTDVSDTSPGWSIANGTGGLYLTSNSLRDSLNTINAAAGHFYLLGYEPGHAEDRQYHHITVHVKRPGVRVVNRQGYLDLPEDERLERLLRLRISTLQPASAVPVTINVTDLKVPGKPAVSMLAAMPFSKVTLLPKNGRYAGRVHVYVSVFDATGNNVGFHHQVQDLSFSPAERDKVLADAFRYKMNLRLDKGEFTIAVTLRDDLSDEIGTAVQKISL